MMNNLYQAILVDHYQHPRNRGSLEAADFSSAQHNPSCGDSVSMQGNVAGDGSLIKLMFQGSGCVISQATASLLTEKILGKNKQEILALDRDFIQELIGMSLGPTRLKCALLPLEALKQGIGSFIPVRPELVEG